MGLLYRFDVSGIAGGLSEFDSALRLPFLDSAAPLGFNLLMRIKLVARLTISFALFSVLLAGPADLRGAWEAEIYRLKSGDEHPVRGLIFFSGENWAVLFFVLDDHDDAKRASAEGGTYKVVEDRLDFTHRYNFSQGGALPGLPASPLRMEIHQAAEAPNEPCRFQIQGDRLTLFFPSGNSMRFRRAR